MAKVLKRKVTQKFGVELSLPEFIEAFKKAMGTEECFIKAGDQEYICVAADDFEVIKNGSHVRIKITNSDFSISQDELFRSLAD